MTVGLRFRPRAIIHIEENPGTNLTASAIVSCLLLQLTTGETSDPGHRCRSNVRATGLKFVLELIQEPVVGRGGP